MNKIASVIILYPMILSFSLYYDTINSGDSMNNLKVNLQEALTTSFIDKDILSQQNYHTELIYNDYKRGTKVLRFLQHELTQASEFMFAVAFITDSGLTVLSNQLKALHHKNIPGKILTSDYLMFNNPKVFSLLMRYPNIEVRILEGKALHTKGYLFKKKDTYSLILGSSNLTANALTKNTEWNIKLNSLSNGKIVLDTLNEFNLAWEKATVLTTDWLFTYQQKYKLHQEVTKYIDTDKNTQDLDYIVPNKMQSRALRNLAMLRDAGEQKALLISSTGTGKTFLSAFDVKNLAANKMLFVIHREQIAKEAMASFKKILPHKKYGLLTGTSKDFDADFLFTTIQTLSKHEILTSFTQTHFDYIVIDEAHHSGAASYQKILNYFDPVFLLGMTATPERTDTYDIYQHFDYNIAYEIRLQEALEEDMLCPFHYFGITDITVDNEIINDVSHFKLLTASERIDHIVDNMAYYGHSGDRVSGLIFVSRTDEAIALEKALNQKGLRTKALTGKDSQADREKAIKALTQQDNTLDYIITVDIFNEGVDIPQINQIVMLRPTQSAIIFIQQLGRGLRKSKNKDYVVILDFIGNYKNNFMIPIALSGDQSYNKDQLKKFLIEGSVTLPGSSTIDYDEITKERIYQSINMHNFSTQKYIKEEYEKLKAKLGKIPKLKDFLLYNSIDPQVFFNNHSFSNYHLLLSKIEKTYNGNLTHYQNKFLNFLSLELSNGKRLDEINIIEKLINQEHLTLNEWNSQFNNKYLQQNIERIFSLAFFVNTDQKKYGQKPILVRKHHRVTFNEQIIEGLNNNPNFRHHIAQIIDYTKLRYYRNYTHSVEHANMTLYQQYTRKDMCRLFCWENDEKGTIYGYRFKYNTYPIFVTYHKADDISQSTQYEDQFLNAQTFSWMTKSRRTLDSQDVLDIKKAEINNIPLDLFVMKDDGEKGQFFYLGPMSPIAYQQKSMIDNKGEKIPVVNIIFRLHTAVRPDIYHYLTENSSY